MLEFDEATHKYTYHGQPLPSVTQVIKSVLPGYQAPEWYLQRGRALHHGCRLMDTGNLDWSTVSPEITGQMQAWAKFKADLCPQIVACEEPLAHPIYRYAGTLDRILLHGGKLVVCDLKSTIEPQVRLQLAAYRLLWEANKGDCIKSAVAVELNEDGNYKTLWLNAAELRVAEQTFFGCLSVFGFAKTHNLKGEKCSQN